MILSHSKEDLAVLEGGMPDYSPLQNYLGLVGAQVSRVFFYLFGLAVYPLLAVLFLRLVRQFVPYKKRSRSGTYPALLMLLLGCSMLFAMWPQNFIMETDQLGIGYTSSMSLALSGGIIGSKLAAPQILEHYEAGLIRRYIGDIGTLITAALLLLPALALLFHRDWYPLLAYRVNTWWDNRLEDELDRKERKRKAREAAEAEEEEEEENDDKGVLPPQTKQQEVPQNNIQQTRPEPIVNDYTATSTPANDEEEIQLPPQDVAPAAPEEPVRPVQEDISIRQKIQEQPIYDDDEVIAPPPDYLTNGHQNRSIVYDTRIHDDDEVVAPPQMEVPRRQAAAPVPVQMQQPVQQPVQQQPRVTEPEPVSAPNPSVQGYRPLQPQATPVRPQTAPQATESKEPYRLPSPTMLTLHPEEKLEENNEFIREQSKILQETLESFGVDGAVTHVTVGPRITQYEISLEKGVKVEKVTSIQNNIAMALAAESIRMRAPIPGKNTIGIEVPNKKSATVYFRPLLESQEWLNSKADIPIILGRDITGEPVVTDLAKAPHLLIAGSTGSGKSVCMNSLVMSLLFKFSPDELRLIMVDPKVVELEMYKKLPHLITPVVNEAAKVPLALRWGVNEMERRYRVLARVPVKNLAAFNSRPPDVAPLYDDDGNRIPQKMPYLIIIIDELADIMMIKEAKVEVENSIARIAQKGRAAGVHLVIATQSPRKEIVTGNIKANLPTKIACKVGSGIDSRVILDTVGAEKLLGRGDMLFNPPGAGIMERIQGCFVSDPEIEKVTQEICCQRSQNFDDNIMVDHVEISGMNNDDDDDEASFGRGRDEFDTHDYAGDEFDDDDDDGSSRVSSSELDAIVNKYLQPGDGDLMRKALEVIILDQKASTSYLQRRLGIGYNKSAELVDKLEKRKILSAPLAGGQKRKILITDGLQVNQFDNEE